MVLVTLTVSATTRIKVGYDEDSETGTHRRVDRVEALTLGLESRALGADAGEKDFRFLGLGGDIVLYVDPTQGIPLRISGNMRYAGRAHLKLRRVVLA